MTPPPPHLLHYRFHSSHLLSSHSPPQHAAALLAKMDELRRDMGDTCDLTIRSDDAGTLPVQTHSLAMAAASPYVLSQITRWSEGRGCGAAALSSASSLAGAASSYSASSSSSSSSSSSAGESKCDSGSRNTGEAYPDKTEITIPGITSIALEAVVEFTYTGGVTLDTDNSDDVLHILAGFQLLNIDRGQATVEQWVVEHLESSNAIRVRHMAAAHGMRGLVDKVDAYIDRHFQQVVAHDAWLMLEPEEVAQILARDQLRAGGEIEVFRALTRWVRRGENQQAVSTPSGGFAGSGAAGGGAAGGGDREKRFAELLGQCIRAPQISLEVLLGEVMVDPLVRSNNDANQIILRAMQEKGAPAAMRGQFASPPALYRRRADMTKIYAVNAEFKNISDINCQQCAVTVDTVVLPYDPHSAGNDVCNACRYTNNALGIFVNIATGTAFDPITGVWEDVDAFNSVMEGSELILQVCNVDVAALDDKLYFLAQGRGTTTQDKAERRMRSIVKGLDPRTGEWTTIPSPDEFMFAEGTSIEGLDGKLYVLGTCQVKETRPGRGGVPRRIRIRLLSVLSQKSPRRASTRQPTRGARWPHSRRSGTTCPVIFDLKWPL